jgi:hypothetical protein
MASDLTAVKLITVRICRKSLQAWLAAAQRSVGDLPLSSCADHDSLCARIAFAGRSGRSHDVQGAYPIDAVSAEQNFIGLAHRRASLDTDP